MKDRITADEVAMLTLIDDPAHRRREPQAYRMACIQHIDGRDLE